MNSQSYLVLEARPWLEAVAALLGFSAIVCAVVAVSCGEGKASAIFSGLALVLSPAFLRLGREESSLEFRSEKALAILALAWIFGIAVATLPLWVLANWSQLPALRPYASLPHAWFEGTSALTSTGLTVVPHPSQLPRSIQLWRSSLQWTGGLGLVAFVAPYLRRHSRRLFSGELGMSDDEKDSTQVLRLILGLYLGLTSLCWVALSFSGVPYWEALNHALCAAATGGFTTTDSSLTGYGPSSLIVVSVTVFISGSSLPVLVHLSRIQDRVDWTRPRQIQILPYVLLIAAMLAVIFSGAFFESETRLGWAFNWVSAISTSGFSAASMDRAPRAFFWLVLAAMVIGACHESTGGGLKQLRLVLLIRRLTPGMGKRRLRVPEREALVLSLIWGGLLCVAAPGVAFLEDAPLRKALFEATSALGGVGLSTGISNSDPHALSALLLSALMLLGRVEVFAVLALLLQPLSARLPHFLVAQNDD